MPLAFTKTDVKRAVAAAKSVGLGLPSSIEFDRSGKFRLIFGDSPYTSDGGTQEIDAAMAQLVNDSKKKEA